MREHEAIMQTSDETVERCGERGSALILVLLLMLALSAIGMVALQSVTRSVERSGLYRVRTTSSAFSDGAANFWMRHSAGQAMSVVRAMKKGDGCLEPLDARGSGGLTRSEWRRLRKRMGGCARYGGNQDSFGDVLATAPHETGLFTDGTRGSFERRMEDTDFEVVVRYPYQATPPEGFSEDKFCFKMVTVATEGRMGTVGPSWDNPQQVGRGRTVFKGKIGPFPCDSS